MLFSTELDVSTFQVWGGAGEQLLEQSADALGRRRASG